MIPFILSFRENKVYCLMKELKMKTKINLLKGKETNVLIKFAIPMIIGNIFQQLYNVADTVIVGKFIGPHALAAVGSSFSVMVLLTSIIIGLCMGSGAVFSYIYGQDDINKLKNSFFTSLYLIGIITIIINVFSLIYLDNILVFINIPKEIIAESKTYLKIILYGLGFTYIYNYFAAVMRSIGDSLTPLVFLIISAIINIVLDIIFVVQLNMGIAGSAYATIIAQGFSALGMFLYCVLKVPSLRLQKTHLYFNKHMLKMIFSFSTLSSIQQSIMNFGILMIQGLVNSFGVAVMAAYAAVVKIDNFAYMPLQDFGNAFSTFVSQNRGAEKHNRIQNGLRSSFKIITIYSIIVTVFIIVFAKPLLYLFIDKNEIEILNTGIQYLYIVSTFYCLIGYLFMFYGFYRGLGKPLISIILTITSLGTRVALAYILSAIPSIGLLGIWWAIPIGWAFADIIGLILLKPNMKNLIHKHKLL